MSDTAVDPTGRPTRATVGAYVDALMACLAEGFVFHRADGAIVHSNAAAQRLLGLTAEQLAVRTATDARWAAVREDGSPLPVEEHPAAVALRTGRPVRDVTLGLPTPEGRLTWLQVAAEPVRDPETGALAGAVATFTSTDAARALAESQARYRALAESAQAREALLRAHTDAMFDPQVLLGAVRGEDGLIVDFEYLEVNRATGEYLAVDPARLVGKMLTGTFPGVVESGLLAALAAAVETGEPLVWDDWLYDNEMIGAPRRYDVRAAKVEDGLTLTWRDVTQRHAAALDLAASEHRYRLLAENASDVVLEHDLGGTVSWVSPSVTDVLGWLPAQIVGRDLGDLLHVDDRAAVALDDEADRVGVEVRVLMPSGEWRWMGSTSHLVRDASGQPVGSVVSWRDIRPEVAARQALARSERLFRLALESAPTGMAVVDLDRHFVEVNPALCRMLGCDEEWLLERRIPDILGPEEDRLDLRLRATVLSGQAASASQDLRLVTADGRGLVVEHSVGVLRDEDGIPVSYVSQFVDVTEARRAQDRLQFLASHDALTSLANRYELSERLAAILSHPPRTGTLLSVLFLDVDDLKTVNDTLGHSAGDTLLVEVARRLRGSVRADDVVARIGGDEFVVALPATRSLDDAVAVAGKIHRALEEPIDLDGRPWRISVSVGAAVAAPGDDGDDLLRRADEALYRAKQQGRARTVADGD